MARIIECIRIGAGVDQGGEHGRAAVIGGGEVAVAVRAEHRQSRRRQRIVGLCGDSKDQFTLDRHIAVGVLQVRQFDNDAVVVGGKHRDRIRHLFGKGDVLSRAGPGGGATIVERQRRRGTHTGRPAVLGEDPDPEHAVGVEAGHGVDQSAIRAASRRRRCARAGVIHDLHRQFRGAFAGERQIGERNRSPGLAARETQALFDGSPLRVASAQRA